MQTDVLGRHLWWFGCLYLFIYLFSGLKMLFQSRCSSKSSWAFASPHMQHDINQVGHV